MSESPARDEYQNDDLNPSPKPDQALGTGLRASDAEREAALRNLGTHFADGRLDRAEFEERADAALAARTQDQLRALFTDLPGPAPVPAAPEDGDASVAASSPSAAAQRGARPTPVPWAPPLILVPVLFAMAILAALHGAPPFPLIPLAFILLRRRRRWNHWNREVRPWT